MRDVTKVHTMTAIVVAAFIIIMLFIMIEPLHFTDTDIEKVYHKNEGLIWFIGLVFAVALTFMTYINGIFQRELKVCEQLNIDKGKLIEKQNDKIIGNQMQYIEQIKDIGEQLNHNFENDSRAREDMLKIAERQLKMDGRILETERQIKKWNSLHNELKSLTQLVKIHNEEIAKLKKNGSSAANKA